jgi:hypothetical protein
MAQFRVGKIDFSQIECRLLNTVAGQWDIVEKFRRGVDLYSELATQFYGFPVDRSKPAQRGTGKQLELSCGYGAGGATIVRTARAGTYGPPVYLTEPEGVAARDLYRRTHPAVTRLWKDADDIILPALNRKLELNWPLSPKGCSLTIKDGRVFHPCGLWLDYTSLVTDGDMNYVLKIRDGAEHKLKIDKDWEGGLYRKGREEDEWFVETEQGKQFFHHKKRGWRFESRIIHGDLLTKPDGYIYKVRDGVRKMYGGRFVENIIQWLASIPIRQRMVQINREFGWRIPLTVHDDVFMLVPNSKQGILDFERAKTIMSAPLDWLPECPIAVEGDLMDALDK